MARTPQAGYLARQIERLRASGLTRREVAAQTGIGERTQRKLISGETPGTRVYRRIIPKGSGVGRGAIRRGVDIPRSAEPGHFSIVVRNADGSYMRIPVILPEYDRATHLTVFDKARITHNANVQEVLREEILKRYPNMQGNPLSQATVMDVVPIINSHTTDIPWVYLR